MILCEIATKNRHLTTLPLAVMSIVMQSGPVDKLIIIDDSENEFKFNDHPLYQHIFSLAYKKGIKSIMFYRGQQKGQVASHQMAIEIAKQEGYEYIWRVDDDEYAEVDVCKTLHNTLVNDAGIGAVGCLVHIPVYHQQEKPDHAQSKMVRGREFESVEFYMPTGEGDSYEVEHLHSTFMYRVESAIKAGGYPNDLSPAGHREETMFTYRIKKAGYRLLVSKNVVVWHLRYGEGGIRDHKQIEYWESDDIKFQKEVFGDIAEKFYVVLDNGLGDHYIFRKDILPRLLAKHKNIVIASCYPDVFGYIDGVEQISIAEAKSRLGDIGKYSIYHLIGNKEAKNISKAYEVVYGL